MQNTLLSPPSTRKSTLKSTRTDAHGPTRQPTAGWRALGTALAMACTLMASGLGSAHAQTSYTLRELPAPSFPTTQNEWKAQSLGDNGDVSGVASWVSGQTWAFDLTSLSFYRTSTYAYRLPVWRNSGGSASLLPLPFGGSVGWGSDHGVDGTGRVLGYVQSAFSPSYTWWTGTQRSTLSPSSLSRFPINWFVSRTNAAGKVAAYSNEPSPRVVILSGRSTVQDLPLPPEPGLTTGNAKFSQSGSVAVLINNQDQVALITDPTSISAGTSTKVWFWSGTAWVNITPPKPAETLPRSPSYIDLTLFDLNNAGQVLVGELGAVFNTSTGAQDSHYYKWVVTPGQGMTPLPQAVADTPGMLVLADNGDVAGLFPGHMSSGGAIWRQGQVTSLNTLTQALPSGARIADVVDANAKGQLLVRLRGEADERAIRFGVLTPR